MRPEAALAGMPAKDARRGALNKVTRDIKEVVIGALMAEGGVKYLRQQAARTRRRAWPYVLA